MDGQIAAVFSKLSALHAKNQFGFAIVVGELFAPASADSPENDELQQLLDGKIEVPLPTYFALGKRLLPDRVVEKLRENSGELCSNLYFLGRRTTVKTSEGIKVVALGGAFEGDVIKEKTSLNEFTPAYSNEDVKILRGANNADILITSEWPEAIRTGSRVNYAGDDLEPSQRGVADLCSWLKPRYHFSTSGSFFEREPFFHAQEPGEEGFQITRFLSLAPYGNPNKQKWIYAFSLDPKTAPPVAITAGITASPLSVAPKKRKEPSNELGAFSRYGNGDNRGHRNKRARAPPPTPSECFFCLSNPNIASHLITSIGNSAYLTTAKGPLSTPETFSALKFPGHILIIPLEHSPTLAGIQDAQSREDTLAEMHKYRKALQKMVGEMSASGEESEKLGAVTWEVSRAGGIHTHWQFMPVPYSLVQRGLVEAAYKVEAENENYPKFKDSASTETITDGGDYFQVRIWADDTPEKVFTLPLDSSFRFDLQFGRRVLAKLMDLMGRMHWQDCGQTEVEETADAESFKTAFKEYDFSLED